MYAEHTQPAQGQRRYTIIAASLGWSGLVIQLYLIFFARWADDASLIGGLVRFFSFFTVLSPIPWLPSFSPSVWNSPNISLYDFSGIPIPLSDTENL